MADETARGDILFLLGRVAWRLVQATLVTTGVVLTVGLLTPHRGDTKERAYRAAIRSDLRNLVTAQEAYLKDHQTYAPTLDALGPKLYMKSTGVSVVIEHATAAGFTASGTHPGTPFRCAIFIGEVAPPRAGAQPGAPFCWKG